VFRGRVVVKRPRQGKEVSRQQQRQQQQYTTRQPAHPLASRVTQQLNNFPAPKFAASYALHTADAAASQQRSADPGTPTPLVAFKVRVTVTMSSVPSGLQIGHDNRFLSLTTSQHKTIPSSTSRFHVCYSLLNTAHSKHRFCKQVHLQ